MFGLQSITGMDLKLPMVMADSWSYLGWWLILRRRGFWLAWGSVFCMPIGGGRVWFLMRRLYCTLDRQSFWLRMIWEAACSFCLLCLSFVAVVSDSWCADSAAFWIGKGFGWGWFGRLLVLSASCVFPLWLYMPVCLKLTTSLPHWWAPTVSI